MFKILSILIFGILILKTDRINCVCGKPLKQKGRGREETAISIYTRDGIIEGKHLEFRCSGATRPSTAQCTNGYYYGYYTSNRELYYNEDALAREYLITSRKTG